MKKRILISAISILLVVGIAVGVICAVSTSRSIDKYWSETVYTDPDISEYSEKIKEELDEQDKRQEELIAILYGDNLKELSESEKQIINDANACISKYFNDVYHIDVTDTLNSLVINKGSLPERVAGFTDLHNIVLFDEPMDDDSLKVLYIHEAIHALGFDNYEVVYIFEGITEYLTQQVAEYNELYYYSDSVYVNNTVLAKQFISADKEFVSDLLNSNVSLKERIDSKLGEGAAKKLSDLCLLDCYSDIDDLRVLMQYIMAEYCKTVSDNAREIVRDNTIYKNFELKVLKWN